MKLKAIILFTFLVGVISPAWAADNETVIKGPVLRVDNATRTLTVRNSETRKRIPIHIPETATITRDGEPATLRRFRRGDLATVRTIRRIDGMHEAVAARVPDTTIVVDLPPVEETMAAAPMMKALPKTASNNYVSLYLGLALLALALVIGITRARQRT